MNFVQIAEFDWLPWQHKYMNIYEYFEKNIQHKYMNIYEYFEKKKKFKTLLLRSRKGDEAETLHTCS